MRATSGVDGGDPEIEHDKNKREVEGEGKRNVEEGTECKPAGRHK